jgi:hypothetical protein
MTSILKGGWQKASRGNGKVKDFTTSIIVRVKRIVQYKCKRVEAKK